MISLHKRLLYTICLLIVYRFGAFIPIAGIDSRMLMQLAEKHAGGILGMFNMLSGGSLARMSVFALGITPYITSSIMMHLMSFAYAPFEALKKEGEVGRRKLSQYTRYLTILLAIGQAYGIVTGLEQSMGGALVVIPSVVFKVSAITTLVVGTMLLMWFGDQITAKGVGNGASLIIFTGIVASIPSNFISIFELARRGVMDISLVILAMVMVILMITTIIFFERAARKVQIHYPRAAASGGGVNYMPLKLNSSGVIPPMFAATMISLLTSGLALADSVSPVIQWLSYHLGRGKPIFGLLYAACIVFFSFFYTSMTFNTEEVAENLKKQGAFISGRRPGKSTVEHFDDILTKLTVLGSAYLCMICVIPEFILSRLSINLALTGTSLLIVVNVIVETFSQIQTHALGKKYEDLVKKMRVHRRIR